jgi:hydrogenase expression/formation protein HypC
VCLGIPGRIEAIRDDQPLRMGTVDFGGIRKPVCLATVPEATVGDWVVVHAGVAISLLDPAEAEQVLGLLEEL